MAQSTSLHIVGVMTGTSCDGLDAVHMKISDRGMTTLDSLRAEYPTALRSRVLDIQTPGSKHSLKALLEIDRDLGIWFAKTLKPWCSRKPVDLIANHGQTVAHHRGGNQLGTTLQLGDPFILAARTGITVCSQFRRGDLAMEGEGAPLLPIFHQKIIETYFSKEDGVAIHNLGGISNLSYFRKGICEMAFDTGPANCWIDAATQHMTRGRLSFDRDGKIAQKGEIDHAAVARARKLPYFKLSPPKSTGRDDFHAPLLFQLTKKRDEDFVTTATEITVQTVVDAYQKFIIRKSKPLKKIILLGGGAKNPFLVRKLQKHLRPVQVVTSDSLGLDSQLIEAQGFAYMGYLSLQGKALGGKWTGAKKNAPPGFLIPAENWKSLLRKIR